MLEEEIRAVVEKFVAAINGHDPESLGQLMTRDHVLVDSEGAELQGRDAVKAAWQQYYEFFPDYTIDVEDVLSGDDSVALFGVARGTYAREGETRPEDSWEIPAAWRAVVRDGKIAEWSVFADNDPVRRIVEGDPNGLGYGG